MQHDDLVIVPNRLVNRYFYLVKPLIPRPAQVALRRMRTRHKLKKCAAVWPIDERAGAPPPGWKGWPGRKRFAFVLQHDVDTQVGHDKCRRLMDLEEQLGVRSTFYVVPERYPVSRDLLEEIVRRGFGLGVHGLRHDGKLFRSFREFRREAVIINGYLHAWNTKGFSSPSMFHRLEWMHHLDIEYSTSTFDTDPFEPQPDSVGTIFPFLVANHDGRRPFAELPYTLPQDFTLFIIMQEANIGIWQRKLDWVAARGGMALVNTHPDYMDFTGGKNRGPEEYPVQFYRDFIAGAQTTYAGDYWHALPHEVAAYIKSTAGGKP